MTDIPVHGSLVIGPYKGYVGRAEYDTDAGSYHGEVTDTKDVITFVGREPSELVTAFKDSVDEYLAFCHKRGELPNKPLSGKFLVRVTPTLHHRLVISAALSGKSLNQFVVDTLEGAAFSESEEAPMHQIAVGFADMGRWIVDEPVVGIAGTSITTPPISLGRWSGVNFPLPAVNLARRTGTY